MWSLVGLVAAQDLLMWLWLAGVSGLPQEVYDSDAIVFPDSRPDYVEPKSGSELRSAPAMPEELVEGCANWDALPHLNSNNKWWVRCNGEGDVDAGRLRI